MSAVSGSIEYGNQTSSRERRRNTVPVHLLEEERALPSTCFTITLKGISEGFFLDFKHPGVGDSTALILDEGKNYVLRDAINDRGCLYEIRNGQAFVRRASLGEGMTRGGKRFPLLRKLGESPAYLLYISCNMPQGMRQKEGYAALHYGVDGNCRIVAKGGSEFLVEVEKDGFVKIFFPTGDVFRVTYDAFKTSNLQTLKMSPGDALSERLVFVENRLAAIPLRQLDELASMIRMTDRFPDLRKKIIHAVGRSVKHDFDGILPPDLHKKFYWALCSIGQQKENHPWWMKKR